MCRSAVRTVFSSRSSSVLSTDESQLQPGEEPLWISPQQAGAYKETHSRIRSAAAPTLALIMGDPSPPLLPGNKTVREKLWILGSFFFNPVFFFALIQQLHRSKKKSPEQSIPAPPYTPPHPHTEGTTGGSPPVFAGGRVGGVVHCIWEGLLGVASLSESTPVSQSAERKSVKFPTPSTPPWGRRHWTLFFFFIKKDSEKYTGSRYIEWKVLLLFILWSSWGVYTSSVVHSSVWALILFYFGFETKRKNNQYFMQMLPSVPGSP